MSVRRYYGRFMIQVGLEEKQACSSFMLVTDGKGSLDEIASKLTRQLEEQAVARMREIARDAILAADREQREVGVDPLGR